MIPMAMLPSSTTTLLPQLRLLLLPLLHSLPSNSESFNPSRHPAVTRRMQDDLSDFLFVGAVVQGAAHVGCEFGGSVLVAKEGYVEERAGFESEAWA